MISTATNQVDSRFIIAGTGEIESPRLLITLEHEGDHWVASIWLPVSEYGSGPTAQEAVADLLSSIVDYAGLLERHPDMMEPEKVKLIELAKLLEPKGGK